MRFPKSKISSSGFIAISFLLFCFTACSVKEVKESQAQSLLRAGHFVDQYGQVVDKSAAAYLQYIQNRLSSAMSKAEGRPVNTRIILLNTVKPMAFSAGGGIILISRGLVLALQGEAELAFVIAHEMAHEHLGHNKKLDQERPHIERDFETESAADKIAVAILAASGYDPRLALNALNNSYRAADNSITLDQAKSELKTRRIELISYIEESGWRPPGTVDRRDFQVFRQSLSK